MAERNFERDKGDTPAQRAAINALNLPDDAVCLQCGYALVGLAEPRCPECGRAFDPLDIKSFGPLVDPMRSPPTTTECVLSAVIAFLMLIKVSDVPGGMTLVDMLMACLIAPVAPIVLFFYGVRFLTALIKMKSRTSKPFGNRSPLRWVVGPVCGLLVLSCLGNRWPMQLRFWLSQSAFETAVEQVKAGEFRSGRWVGLYYVSQVDAWESGIYFYTHGSGLHKQGFVHLSNPAQAYKRLTVKDVAPEWHTFQGGT